MGHVRDLPENRLSVDVKKHFQPKYTVIKGKEKLVEELEKMADKSEAVFLATDPDREGEAISWHLAYLLKLDPEDQNRPSQGHRYRPGQCPAGPPDFRPAGGL